MTNDITKTDKATKSLMASFAGRYDMEPKAMFDTLMATVMPSKSKPEDVAAFLMVCQSYNLNPMTKEAYAFPGRGGGISVVVGVDGWVKLIHSQGMLDGIGFSYEREQGKVVSVTCCITRKDMAQPIEVTEFLSECYRATEPWKQSPTRMLRHKALMQCARYAFGFSAIYDEDEAAIIAAEPKDVEPAISDKAKKVVIESLGKSTAERAAEAVERLAKDAEARAKEAAVEESAGQASTDAPVETDKPAKATKKPKKAKAEQVDDGTAGFAFDNGEIADDELP